MPTSDIPPTWCQHVSKWHVSLTLAVPLPTAFCVVPTCRPTCQQHVTPTNTCQLFWPLFWYANIQLCQQRLPVMAFNSARTSTGIFALWFSTSMGRFHYWYWQSMMPVPALAFLHFGSVSVWAHSILLVMAFNCAHTCTGIFAFWFSTSMGMDHYRYWYSVVSVPVLAFWNFGSVPVWAYSITGTGINWCPYRYWHLWIFVQYQYWKVHYRYWH